jgi:hypothetical protein
MEEQLRPRICTTGESKCLGMVQFGADRGWHIRATAEDQENPKSMDQPMVPQFVEREKQKKEKQA